MTMKKLIFVFTVFTHAVYSQVDQIGHLSNSVYYVGWNNLSTDPLNIMHQTNYPINFYTQGGITGPPWANLRMQIHENPAWAADPTAGFVGIGTAAIPPIERLDIDGNIHMPQNGTINLNGGNRHSLKASRKC